jgi:hypothetical protein
VVLSTKTPSEHLACLIAPGDRRRRVNLQHADAAHVEPDGLRSLAGQVLVDLAQQPLAGFAVAEGDFDDGG